MDYPNVMAPSPQEIYDGLKMIPNDQQGKLRLSQIAQQGKQSGSVEGGIAAALLNSYNQMQPSPPPPQGQVVDQVIAQAQPPMQFDPSMLGLAAPGLEQAAQQNAQQMAAGGIVALAGGGPVRGFGWGGVADLPEAWGQGMPDVPEAPDTSAIEQDYFSAPEATNTEAAAPTRRTVGAGESPRHSIDEQIDRLGQLYDAPPDILAEMISRREHDAAKREKMNAFEAIASGLSGYLSSYGSGAHRAGAGLASMLGTMGAQQKQAAEDEATIEGYRYKAAMQPYEIHKDLVNQVLTAQTAHDKAAAEAQLKMWEKKYERDTEYMKQQHQTAREEMQNRTSIDVGAGHDAATIEAAKIRGDVGPGGITWNQALVAAGQDIKNQDYDDPREAQRVRTELANMYFTQGRGTGSPAQQTSTSFGQPVQLGGGKYTGWLR